LFASKKNFKFLNHRVFISIATTDTIQTTIQTN
jgi:hypothetical protein